MGYHLAEIKKGELGKWSKVEEELAEYEDAKLQDSKIMMAIELSDLFGALEKYCQTHKNKKADEVIEFMLEEARKLNLNYYDLMKFSDITKRAFKSGARK